MGLFEFADKGTIFLDEIGDMPLGTQAKLLRDATESGGTAGWLADAAPGRCAGNRRNHKDLRKAIAERQFREDLYYRLSMIEIRVPSMAERKEDLPLLTRFFVDKFASQFGKEIRGMTQRAQILIARHEWPGNIRELENVLGYACMMALGDTLDVQDLPEQIRSASGSAGSGRGPVAMPVPLDGIDGNTLAANEKQLIANALASARGNQSEAARILRIGRDALRYKIIKHGLEVPGTRKAAIE